MTRSGSSRLRFAASPRYAASFVSGFSRIVHVLKTTTSASAALGASPRPSSSSMPLMRSESWAFIWQPNVVTWYRRTAGSVAGAWGADGSAPHARHSARRDRAEEPVGLVVRTRREEERVGGAV